MKACKASIYLYSVCLIWFLYWISEPVDPNSMLKGMKGYQLTQRDLEFIEKMKEEKLIKKLQVILCLSHSLLL